MVTSKCISGVYCEEASGALEDFAVIRGRSRKENLMKAKEKVRDLLDRLPDDCSLEDILYHLYVVRAIERGSADAEAGRTISHEEVEERLRRKWLLGTAG